MASQVSPRSLLGPVFLRLGLGIVAVGALFFGTAGTFAYWEAWAYLGILFIPMIAVVGYLLAKDPALLERRLRTREREAQQKRIIRLSFLVYLLAFILPGLGERFGWPKAPAWLAIAAQALVLLSYGLFVLVLRENSYASRVIEVAEGQGVISTGPYAAVRHPMYSALLTLYVVSPLALGSYWAVIPALLLIPIIVARIRNEEQVLAGELPGYREYLQKTRYRLIPGVW